MIAEISSPLNRWLDFGAESRRSQYIDQLDIVGTMHPATVSSIPIVAHL